MHKEREETGASIRRAFRREKGLEKKVGNSVKRLG